MEGTSRTGAPSRAGALRVGTGVDVHRLVYGRPLVLGGVRIPHANGLDGHSDADVLTHALMDALLSAARLPDIGELFPDDNPAYEGADSVALLARVAARLREEGFEIVDCDLTLVAQAPKVAPYKAEMRRNLARALGVDADAVGLKATTTEGLGFVGADEGMAALATCLLCRR